MRKQLGQAPYPEGVDGDGGRRLAEGHPRRDGRRRQPTFRPEEQSRGAGPHTVFGEGFYAQ